MIPQEHLATATIPGPEVEIRLYRHDRDYMFLVRGTELMTSRIHGAEEMLAELALARLGDRAARASVLVGGLGMGFTLAAVLRGVGDDAEVEVVELMPEIVAWNHQWLGELCGHPLKDPRVTVYESDVVPRIRAATEAYDVILLDVDNGPEGLLREQNDRLYTASGLRNARKALRPGGVFAIWSSSQDPHFFKRLAQAGFDVTEERVRARRTKGPKRYIWLATKRG